MVLTKCIELKDNIENAILMYKHGEISDLLSDVPINKSASLRSYIFEIENCILPQLDYIIESLKANRKIIKSKITFGRYIVHEWSNDSKLGSALLEINSIVMNKH